MMETGHKLTICAKLLAHALLGARNAGLDIQRLLRKSGIKHDLFQHPEKRIPVDQAVMLQRYCSGVMNDEINGLLAKPQRLGHFKYMALSAIHCPTLGHAIERSLNYLNLFENSFHYQLVKNKNQVQIVLKLITGQHIKNSYAIDLILCGLHRFFGWLCNRRILLDQVQLSFSPPDYHDEYPYTYYGSPVLFNQAANSISFPLGYLDQPIIQSEETLDVYIRRTPLDLYLPLDAGGETTEQLRTLILDTFNKYSQPPELDVLAHNMSLQPHTLRRRLKKEGTSFHNVKAHVRRDIAIHYLGNADMSIEAISEQAGYSEPSAFIRAFKNWTGFTPLQFRKGLKF